MGSGIADFVIAVFCAPRALYGLQGFSQTQRLAEEH
jgi:hypothetical protein